MKKRNGIHITSAAIALMAATPSCSTIHSVFVGDGDKTVVQPPIRDPFGYSGPQASGGGQPTILRSKKGDRTVELELPAGSGGQNDLVVPLSSAFKNDVGRGIASEDRAGNTVDESYLSRHPSMADREITSTFPQSSFDDRGRRQDLEQGLGLVPAEDPTPQKDTSYLAGIDRIKQLYRLGRFEAGLLETDEMIRQYQTDAHLYEMRGTLLDRIGKRELAIKSWSQALRFDPGNARLKKFIDRKRRIAVEAGSTPMEASGGGETTDRAPAGQNSAGGAAK